eukprot:652548-Rhodomonas_salina.2
MGGDRTAEAVRSRVHSACRRRPANSAVTVNDRFGLRRDGWGCQALPHHYFASLEKAWIVERVLSGASLIPRLKRRNGHCDHQKWHLRILKCVHIKCHSLYDRITLSDFKISNLASTTESTRTEARYPGTRAVILHRSSSYSGL